MKSSLAIAALLFSGSIFNSLGQTAPSQPVDPTAQSPSTVAPSTPPTFPPGTKQTDYEKDHSTSATKKSAAKGQTKTFTGTIIRKGHSYVLKARDAEYLLEDHGEAKNYKGKYVKVTGISDENKVLKVQTMELSSIR